MRAMDWVGIVLIGGALAGGAFYFVKMRPLNTGPQSPTGVPVAVVPQGAYFAPPPVQPASGTATGQDVMGVIGEIGGLATALFPNGIGGLFD